MGMFTYYNLEHFTFMIEDLTVIILFIVTYVFYFLKKISRQTSMKILAILIVLEMFYPTIIYPSHVPQMASYEGSATMYIILVFVVAFTTNKQFSIFITASIILLITINTFIIHNEQKLEELPIIVYCIAGMGYSSVVFENQIRKLLRKVNEAKDKIQELSKYKQNIINYVIHDLKVPVSVILNLSAENKDAKSKNINYQAYNINKQLEKILDIERMEAPNVILNKENVAVSKIVNNAINSVKTIALEKNIAISLELNAKGKLYCDEDLIKRLIINILLNALKYSPSNSQVDIRVNADNEDCEILIKDNGYGIAKEQLEHIFDKFYSVKKEKSESAFSTGLGLTFCKLVTEVHKGSISVNSVFGKGTEFILIIPEYNNDIISEEIDLNLTHHIVFSSDELKFLQLICNNIKDIPIYNGSKIINITKHLTQDKRENIRNWYTQLCDAIYTGNKASYNDLMLLCTKKTNF